MTPDLDLIYYGSGNPSPWNETMRPGDNKWTTTVTARDADTGLMKWGYQKTPHDEWDYAGINVMMLSEQKDKTGKMRKLVTHPGRNGVVYTLDRESGELISADFLDDTVNVFKKVDLKTGLPVRDPEFNTRMDHRTKDACPSAMGYHNQGLDSYDPEKRLFFMGINHLCMDWEPFMLPYRAGQFFVGANVWTYPGPKGDKAAGVGSGQVKAYNAISGDYEWEKMERFAVWGGTLATKGDLVFYGLEQPRSDEAAHLCDTTGHPCGRAAAQARKIRRKRQLHVFPHRLQVAPQPVRALRPGPSRQRGGER